MPVGDDTDRPGSCHNAATASVRPGHSPVRSNSPSPHCRDDHTGRGRSLELGRTGRPAVGTLQAKTDVVGGGGSEDEVRAGLDNPTGLATTRAPWERAKLRTNYGPPRPNSPHFNGQPWTRAMSGSVSTSVDDRSGGQGVASSNLASPTKQIHPIRPSWACIQPTFLPPSITPSYIDLVRGLPLTLCSSGSCLTIGFR